MFFTGRSGEQKKPKLEDSKRWTPMHSPTDLFSSDTKHLDKTLNNLADV